MYYTNYLGEEFKLNRKTFAETRIFFKARMLNIALPK